MGKTYGVGVRKEGVDEECHVKEEIVGSIYGSSTRILDLMSSKETR